MTIIAEGITLERLSLPYLRTVPGGWHTSAHRRLTEAFEAAKKVLFNDSSRIVLFSDCHRGDNSRTDAFARNKELFLRTLTHYYREGFVC